MARSVLALGVLTPGASCACAPKVSYWLTADDADGTGEVAGCGTGCVRFQTKPLAALGYLW